MVSGPGVVEVDSSKVTKYLGCYLDEKLNWNHHIQQKMNSVKKLIYMIRNAIGKIYGPQPVLYYGLIKPW